MNRYPQKYKVFFFVCFFLKWANYTYGLDKTFHLIRDPSDVSGLWAFILVSLVFLKHKYKYPAVSLKSPDGGRCHPAASHVKSVCLAYGN